MVVKEKIGVAQRGDHFEATNGFNWRSPNSDSTGANGRYTGKIVKINSTMLKIYYRMRILKHNWISSIKIKAAYFGVNQGGFKNVRTGGGSMKGGAHQRRGTMKR